MKYFGVYYCWQWWQLGDSGNGQTCKALSWCWGLVLCSFGTTTRGMIGRDWRAGQEQVVLILHTGIYLLRRRGWVSQLQQVARMQSPCLTRPHPPPSPPCAAIGKFTRSQSMLDRCADSNAMLFVSCWLLQAADWVKSLPDELHGNACRNQKRKLEQVPDVRERNHDCLVFCT